MSPNLPMNNHSYQSAGHSVFYRHGRLFSPRSGRFFSNLRDGFIIQLGQSVSFSMNMPAFCLSICHIVGLASKKKMFRIYATRVITFMANKHSVRNFSIEYFPRCSMRQLRADVSAATNSTVTISNGTSPLPTTLCLENFLEKSFFKRYARHRGK